MDHSKPSLMSKLIGIVGVCLILLIFVYVEVGFFYADPYVTGTESILVKSFLFSARMITPLVGLALAYLVLIASRRKVRFSFVFPGLLGVIAIFAFFYPALEFVYTRSMQKRLSEFHPYLQLMPHDFKKTAGAAAPKVFCLGGSTTEFTDSHGRGWPQKTSEILRDHYGTSANFFNFGRQWYTTQHLLIDYNANLSQYKPDVIIIMESINDLLQNADFSYFSTGPFREDYGHFLGPVRRLILQPTLLSASLETARMFWYAPERTVLEVDTFPGLESFRRNLLFLIEAAKRDGAAVVLMTQPSLFKDQMSAGEIKALTMINREAIGPKFQWSVGTGKAGMAKYSQAVRKIAADSTVKLIDLDKIVPKSMEYFIDDVHYTDNGFQLVAETVAGGLESFGVSTQINAGSGK